MNKDEISIKNFVDRIKEGNWIKSWKEEQYAVLYTLMKERMPYDSKEMYDRFVRYMAGQTRQPAIDDIVKITTKPKMQEKTSSGYTQEMSAFKNKIDTFEDASKDTVSEFLYNQRYIELANLEKASIVKVIEKNMDLDEIEQIKQTKRLSSFQAFCVYCSRNQKEVRE